jgi:hypothetical protein
MTFNGRKTFAIISTAKSIAQAAVALFARLENGKESMMGLKVYTFEDNLFCYGVVVVAESAEQAVALWNAKSDSSPLLAEWMEEHELEGFTFEAGGNG